MEKWNHQQFYIITHINNRQVSKMKPTSKNVNNYSKYSLLSIPIRSKKLIKSLIMRYTKQQNWNANNPIPFLSTHIDQLQYNPPHPQFIKMVGAHCGPKLVMHWWPSFCLLLLDLLPLLASGTPKKTLTFSPLYYWSAHMYASLFMECSLMTFATLLSKHVSDS